MECRTHEYVGAMPCPLCAADKEKTKLKEDGTACAALLLRIMRNSQAPKALRTTASNCYAKLMVIL